VSGSAKRIFASPVPIAVFLLERSVYLALWRGIYLWVVINVSTHFIATYWLVTNNYYVTRSVVGWLGPVDMIEVMINSVTRESISRSYRFPWQE
jgi:hypothetical protein